MKAGECVLLEGWSTEYEAFCVGDTEEHCMAGAGYAYCSWQSNEAVPAGPGASLSKGECVLQEGQDLAFANFCQGTTEQQCMDGVRYAYCSWQSNESIPSASVG